VGAACCMASLRLIAMSDPERRSAEDHQRVETCETSGAVVCCARHRTLRWVYTGEFGDSLRHCATSRKVAGPIPDDVIEFSQFT
jgi:hypothetical protein